MGESAVALALPALIGLEREVGQKSTGLRTHALAGLGSALFVEVSRYGFGPGDPSRVDAQVVSGIGFIGGGSSSCGADHRRDHLAHLRSGHGLRGWTPHHGHRFRSEVLPHHPGYPFLLRHLAPLASYVKSGSGTSSVASHAE